MKTGNVEFDRAIYLRTEINSNNTTWTYELRKSTNNKNENFTEKIRIEVDNGFHEKSRYFDYWLYFRDETNWKRCKKTGLAKTNHSNIFEGNISIELLLNSKNEKGKNFETPKHLIIVKEINNFEKLEIDIFNDNYIHDKRILKLFIDEHIQENKSINLIEHHE